MNRRITKPPGGETNEIFTTPNSTPPSTPRKVKNYMASNIFTPDGQGGEQRNVRHRPDDNSFSRLFGAQGNGDSTDSPRGKNHQKSSIIFADAGNTNGTNGTTNGTNGHTNGHSNGHTNGSNGHTNGTTNGHNGTTNGSSNGHDSGSSSGASTPKSSGSINGDSPKINGSNGTNGTHAEVVGKRIPPGGFSSKLW